MSFAYTRAKAKLISGDIDLNTHDIRALLVMTNTTADTEEDTEFISGVATLDEMNGANYARQALANEAVAADLVNNRGEFDADDITFTSLGVGTRQVAAVVIFRFVTNDADSPLIGYIDTGGFPLWTNGGNLSIQWNAEGILQAT